MGSDTDNATKLTNRTIRGFAYLDRKDRNIRQGGADVRWDSKIAGLGLRVYPSGKKSFMLAFRLKGRKYRMVLGAFGAMTVEQARTDASDNLALVRKGTNPLEEKRRADRGDKFGDLLQTTQCSDVIQHWDGCRCAEDLGSTTTPVAMNYILGAVPLRVLYVGII